MSKLPSIPKEQRNFGGERPRDRLRSAEPDRRDRKIGVQSPDPGDADNRYGAMPQNPTPQRGAQDR